jgi:hypothetical protein
MRKLMALVIVLVVLLVIADRVACWTAERAIADQIQTSNNLAERPEVKVSGFPFLTQALRGRYRHIDASAENLSADGRLTIDRLQVQLKGVHVKLADALRRQVSSAPVDQATADATVGYPSINAVVKDRLSTDRLSLQFGPGQDGRLSVTGGFHSSLADVKIDGEAEVSIKDGRLSVKLAPQTLADLPTLVRGTVNHLLAGSYRLPPLPFGFTAKSVTVGPNGVTIRAEATSVELG